MTEKIDRFVHLHAHGSYSLLDGHALYGDMMEEMARLGQPAGAITEHGNLHGAYEFYRAGQKHGVKAIIGIEAYFTPGQFSHTHKEPVFFGRSLGDSKIEGSNDVSGGGTYTHMTLLAENNDGLHNLFRLSSLSYIEGYYRKPRMSLEMLSQYSKGIIATTGCPSGEIQTRLRLGQWDEALSYAAQMQDILGKDNYFLELMDHNMSIELERGVRNDLLRLAKELNIPLLATNDLHYTKREHAISHEQMLAVQTGSVMSELPDSKGGKRFAFEGEEYYVKSREEMERYFRELPEALDNTLLVAERCNVSFDTSADLRPKIEIPDGYTPEEWLRKEALEGLARRLPDKANDPVYLRRIGDEIGTMVMKDYVGYHLVVSDFVRWAKKNGVPTGHGRGSAGGSLVAYALDITDLDPIRHNLIFERYINPERDSPPDIDMDFADSDRDRVIDYVTHKYGKDKVAMIATFTKIGAKTAVKDAAKILEQPYSLGNELTKALPEPVFGREVTLAEVYNPTHDRYEEGESFRSLVKEKGADEIVQVARGFEGRVRTTGVHAAGIIISSKPLIDTIPLMMRQKDEAVITQFDYPTCETLGLLKVDFLGLRNLTVIQDAVNNIKDRHGVTIDIRELVEGSLDDPKTFDLLARGDTLGVFQLDGGAMRDLLRRMKPTAFNDISAVLALYRPGPMGVNAHNDYADRKNGRQKVVPIHPELDEPLREILGDTYQLIVFQEQVMQIAAKVAGYSLAKADNLRRAMGKKKREVLEAEYEGFSQGMRDNGYSEEAIKTLWDILVPFADYSFNRSHTAGYGLISYATAWLKAHYPAEYMAALLTSVGDDKDKTALYLNECRRLGIKVLPPSVSRSKMVYTATADDEILFGLGAVRGMGEETAQALVESRKGKEFTSISDFLERAPRNLLNKRVLSGLIDAGGFDGMGYSRQALNEYLPDLARATSTVKKKAEEGQDSLFAALEDDGVVTVEVDIPQMNEYTKKEKLSRERHALGLYVSDHPLSGMREVLESQASGTVVEILSGDIKPVEGFSNDAPKTRLAGVVTAVNRKKTKMGDDFAILTFEDMTGTIEVVVFPKTYREYGSRLAPDNVYVITGLPRVRGDEEEATPNFVADRLEVLEVTENGKIPVWIKVTREQCTHEGLNALKEVLLRHRGESPVRMSIKEQHDNIVCMELGDDLRVTPGPALVAEIREVFGVECVGRWRRASSD